jgi:hypothetical protein
MLRLSSALLVAVFALEDLRSDETQDRADLPTSIDTWYRVLQGKRPAGYVHEMLSRAARPWRYEYALQGEFELTLRGKPHVEDQTVAAILDDAFFPMEYSSESRVNEIATEVSLFADREERRLEFHPASGDPVSWVRPASEELYALPSLMIYALRQNESLGKAGRITARLIDPRGLEKDGVEVALVVGDSLKREYLGKPVSVIPIAFPKPFPAGSLETQIREVFVDRYGRILEAVMGSGVRIVIARDREEALTGTGVLPRAGRRDPFDKMAVMKNAARERLRNSRSGPEIVPPTVTLDTLMSTLNDARKLVEELRAHQVAGELEEARQTYSRALVHLKAVHALASKRRPELLGEINQIRQDAETLWDGAAQMEREARRLYVLSPGQLQRLELSGLEQSEKQLTEIRDRIEVDGRPERDQIAVWASEVGALVVKCKTRIDLAAARLEIVGITMGEVPTTKRIDSTFQVLGRPVGGLDDVTFVRLFAMANINGQTYRQGETIQGTQIRVDQISRQSIQFSLRDEVREVGLRR